MAADKHLTIPKYAPFGDRMNVELYMNAYKARDLLNYAVIAFYKRRNGDLRPTQLAAYKDFTNRFVKRRPAYGGELKEWASLVSFQDDIKFCFDQLDEFFFFRLLGPHVELKSGFHVVGEDPLKIDERIEGETFRSKARNRSYIQININIGAKGTLYKLDAILGQLMHEMIHAYFLLFACGCASCSRDVLNTVGVEDDGHGPLFLMLHRLILSEIRKWAVNDKDGNNSGLDALLADDCPGECISKSARARAEKAIKGLSPNQRWRLNQIRSPKSERYLIRLDDSGKRVVVRPSLKQRQIEWEDSLRDNTKRDREFSEDERVRRGEGCNSDGDGEGGEESGSGEEQQAGGSEDELR
ncbi:hypothetical protein F5Y13DRAFT_192954 [Hypoxylon sp. FL1857]|nr:hypothetical protein F5Y13DRAFT_192954 [Hypoxylon sp. FL1857]